MKVSSVPVDNINIETIYPIIKESLFASILFLNIWKNTKGSPFYIIVEDNDTLIALMPGVEYGAGIFKRFQSLPDGLYSKIYFNNNPNINKNDIIKLIFDYLERKNYIKTFIFDYYNNFTSTAFETINCQTNIVDISKPDYQPPDKKLQSELRKAEREDVNIEPFNGERHLEMFLELMNKTEQRHQRSSRYPEKFYSKLADLSKSDSRVLWYWCQHDNKPVCSHINFIEDDMVLNWQVCFDKQFSNLKANQLMMFNMIKEVSKRGVKYLNLGASPTDAEGLIEYKNKWGGELYNYNCLYRKSFIGKLF